MVLYIETSSLRTLFLALGISPNWSISVSVKSWRILMVAIFVSRQKVHIILWRQRHATPILMNSVARLQTSGLLESPYIRSYSTSAHSGVKQTINWWSRLEMTLCKSPSKASASYQMTLWICLWPCSIKILHRGPLCLRYWTILGFMSLTVHWVWKWDKPQLR